MSLFIKRIQHIKFRGIFVSNSLISLESFDCAYMYSLIPTNLQIYHQITTMCLELDITHAY